MSIHIPHKATQCDYLTMPWSLQYDIERGPIMKVCSWFDMVCFVDGVLGPIRNMMINEQNRSTSPDSKIHVANMGPTWVLAAPDGPHVGLMNLAIREGILVLQSVVRL